MSNLLQKDVVDIKNIHIVALSPRLGPACDEYHFLSKKTSVNQAVISNLDQKKYQDMGDS